jgi:hypothetical protein
MDRICLAIITAGLLVIVTVTSLGFYGSGGASLLGREVGQIQRR